MFAVWSDNKRSAEENWLDYINVRNYFNREIFPYKSDSFVPYLTVEGGALLNNDLSRLDTLKSDGVKILTAVWKDDCCMGGAHNTNRGLTNFGTSAVRKMAEIGIIPDVSHASDKMTYEILELAYITKTPVLATHSNSRKIRSHTRNLTDDMFINIKNSKGLVGISFCCDHLTDTDIENADITSIIRHIEHYMSLGGGNTVCLGCDFDGIEQLPCGIDGAGSLGKLKNELIKLNYGEALVEKIFFENADRFFCEDNT